jgi:hypothetical protein
MASRSFHAFSGRAFAVAVVFVIASWSVVAATFGQEAPVPEQKAQAPRDDSLDAAFGLRWFDSKAEVERQGIDLRHPSATQFGDSYAVSYLPRNVPDMNYAVLSFGYNDQLIRITAIGGEYDGDNDASQVTTRYRELQDVLAKKYGEGEAHSHIEKNYGGGLTALGFQTKKNWMYTVYKKPSMRVELSVISMGAGRMRWRLIFENVDGMAQLEKHRRRSEEAAF